MKRRLFLRSGAISSLGLLFSHKLQSKDLFSDTLKREVKTPKIISTWEHGLAANHAAHKILLKGGTSLDAVEVGVKVTEADADNRSVGLGGLPR